MKQDEIIDMARQAGLVEPEGIFITWDATQTQLEAFAKLVSAKKEEDIIKIIQSLGTWATCEQIEKAIRARGRE